MSGHTPLHDIEAGDVYTAGRAHSRGGTWFLANAHAEVRLDGQVDTLDQDALYRVAGRYDGDTIELGSAELVRRAQASAPQIATGRESSLADATALREKGVRVAREFFASRGFMHVDTPYRVREPGTDVHLEPLEVQIDGTPPTYLHTSPEFAMKELLSAGFERIWQLAHVWRGGEHTALHHPEFSIVEWYRAWEDLDAIIADVEQLTRTIVGDVARVAADDDERRIDLAPSFKRLTMRELVSRACGFDLFDALDHASLLEAAHEHDLLSERGLERARTHRRWDELFFELQVSHLDPFLARQGAVIVTEWPTQLAVLARRKPDDPRVAERFELYVGGIEIANGFAELTDPVEQRQRFEEDVAARQALGLRPLPMPEDFLQALEFGLPPSSGVAVGFDRLLMLASGAAHIRDVIPYAQQPPSSAD